MSSPTTYGIVYGEGADTVVIECESLDVAREAAIKAAEEHGSADVVELEGSGPVLASDGDEIAPTHAPHRTIETHERGADGEVPEQNAQRLARLARCADCGRDGIHVDTDCGEIVVNGEVVAHAGDDDEQLMTSAWGRDLVCDACERARVAAR